MYKKTTLGSTFIVNWYFLRVWKIGHYVTNFLTWISWIMFGVAILIAIEALVEAFIKDNKDKE